MPQEVPNGVAHYPDPFVVLPDKNPLLGTSMATVGFSMRYLIQPDMFAKAIIVRAGILTPNSAE